MNIIYHSLKPQIVLKKLKSNIDGITNKEAEKRLKKYGSNELPREKLLDRFTIFISQFKSPLIYILLFAGSISFLLDEHIDAWVIFGSVFINVIIGFIQENKANNTLSKLKELVEYNTLVIRDGNEIQVLSDQIVVGDIIVIKAGNRISADARLISAISLSVNESSLTGESTPSLKDIHPVSEGASLADRKNMVYAGTTAVRGSARAVVVATGNKTEIGKIAELMRTTTEEKTPLQQRLAVFSRFLGIGIVVLSILIFIIGIIQERSMLEMFIMSVSLAVAAIPEGLIVAVTVILTLGMQRILQKKALTRKLVAAETLGSTTVICTDKTGTLTEGKMHVFDIVISNIASRMSDVGYKNNKSEHSDTIKLALKVGMMCNDAIIENPDAKLASWKIVGAPTEIALMSASIQSGLSNKDILKLEPRIATLPFDSEKKYMISLHKKANKYTLYEKGAAEKLLKKSSFFYDGIKIKKLTKEDLKKLNSTYRKLTSEGLRVIGVATKEMKGKEINEINSLLNEIDDDSRSREVDWSKLDCDLTFIGFIALKDPLRAEAKETIKICMQAGIRPIMITGDHKLTAKAIASEVGLVAKKENIIEGFELDKISDDKIGLIVNKINIYARVSPHHKLRIVKALQAKGEVVAMTGDGINDSPALKAADIGIALGGGTDIAKEASDIILLDNNFKTIVTAIHEGRVIFANIRKVITYLISDSFSEVILIVGCIILGMPLALIPVQILWINIVNDGFPNFALAFEKGEPGVMQNKPLKKKEPILNKEMKVIIFAAGLIRDFFAFGIFYYLLKSSFDIDYIRTMIFAIIGVDSLIYIFSLRSLKVPVWRMNPFSNRVLVLAVIFSFWLLIIAIYWPPLQMVLSTIPLGLNSWCIIFGTAFLSMFMIEAVKHRFIEK